MSVERSFAQVGQTVALRARFILNSVIFDPTQVRLVEIVDNGGVVIATFNAAQIVHDSLGNYHVDWPIPLLEATNAHYDRWYATPTPGAIEEIFTFGFIVLPPTSGVNPAIGQYLSTVEARGYLPSDTRLSDAEIAEMVLLASETADYICGQNFLPSSAARIFDGTGKSVLPIYRPILSVTAVDVLGCGGFADYSIECSDVRISRSHTMLSLGNTLSFSQGGMRNARGGYCSFGSGCGTFPPGFQNIRVTGLWGRWLTVPRQIKAAIGQLLRYTASCNDPLGITSAAFKSESVASDRSYTMRDIWNGVMLNGTTGYADVDAIFARFMAPPVVGWV